jgi:hypothetical protein
MLRVTTSSVGVNLLHTPIAMVIAADGFFAGRRLLFTVAVEAKIEHTVPIAHLRRLDRVGSLDGINVFLTPLFPSHPLTALSTLSVVGLPIRASTLLATIQSPTVVHLNAVLGPLIRRRRLAMLVPSIRAG